MQTRDEARKEISQLIHNEQLRQDEKFGVQILPDVMNEFPNRTLKPHEIMGLVAYYYQIPSENMAKYLCDKDTKANKLTFGRIFIEEVCEAIAAAAINDHENLEKELIQCAAVCIKWVLSNRTRRGLIK